MDNVKLNFGGSKEIKEKELYLLFYSGQHKICNTQERKMERLRETPKICRVCVLIEILNRVNLKFVSLINIIYE